MNSETLNRLLSAVNEFDASDLHLVAGVPPAFRVNGEIIIADEDALTEDEITDMADSLMNELQRKKFEQEWELCISILHSVAGRVRVTFYRRNNSHRDELPFLRREGGHARGTRFARKTGRPGTQTKRPSIDHRPDRCGQDDDAELSRGPHQQ